MTKYQRAVAEVYAPVVLKEIGGRHCCQKKVVGARGQWRKVYCSDCNAQAIKIARRIAASHRKTLDISEGQ